MSVSFLSFKHWQEENIYFLFVSKHFFLKKPLLEKSFPSYQVISCYFKSEWFYFSAKEM